MVATLSKKVCLLGDFAVGKTSLVRRFVYNLFSEKYLSTIGVHVSHKTISIVQTNEITEITMMLWDLAGAGEFSQMHTSYVRGAAGAILVCDLTRPETLNSLQVQLQGLRQANPKAHIVLAANKADLTHEHQLMSYDIEVVATKLKAPYYLTSAKHGDQVEEMFKHLGRLLIG